MIYKSFFLKKKEKKKKIIFKAFFICFPAANIDSLLTKFFPRLPIFWLTKFFPTQQATASHFACLHQKLQGERNAFLGLPLRKVIGVPPDIKRYSFCYV
jgi:thiol-disulfide isomerase/thioredoxin